MPSRPEIAVHLLHFLWGWFLFFSGFFVRPWFLHLRLWLDVFTAFSRLVAPASPAPLTLLKPSTAPPSELRTPSALPFLPAHVFDLCPGNNSYVLVSSLSSLSCLAFALCIVDFPRFNLILISNLTLRFSTLPPPPPRDAARRPLKVPYGPVRFAVLLCPSIMRGHLSAI